MPDAWDNNLNSTFMNPASDTLAFDASDNAGAYAYGYKNSIRTYDYMASVKKGFLAQGFLPEDWMVITDIRFSGDGTSIFATVQHSDTLYRCSASCPDGIYVEDYLTGLLVCSLPMPEKNWLTPGHMVRCAVWASNNALQPPVFGYTMQGACQCLDASLKALVCASGTFRPSGSMDAAARVWVSPMEGYSGREEQYSFAASEFGQMVGPPAFSRVTNTLYLFTYRGPSATRPLTIFQMRFDARGNLAHAPLEIYSMVDTTRKGPSSIVGASIRLDTNKLVVMDESIRSMHAFQLPYPGDANQTAGFSLMYTASYGNAIYKDIEFVSSLLQVAWWDKQQQLLRLPSKLFFTSLEVAGDARAELYVQCAPCKDGGTTDSSKQALSQADCNACQPGNFKLSNNSGCSPCQCSTGEYKTGLSCTYGTDTFNVACRSCRTECPSGSFINGTCTGSMYADESSCPACNTPQNSRCPASALPQSEDLQDTVCVQQDCMRRQAFFYPLDGWDVERDVGPKSLSLVPLSLSSRSGGPTASFFSSAAAGGSSAFFNASNHEYYQIPSILSLFDRQLGYRIVSNVSMWEQGMTLGFWIQFSDFTGQNQCILELSNGFDTEHIQVYRFSNSQELLFRVSHSQKSVQRQFVTANSTLAVKKWQHIVWTVLPSPDTTYYDAVWNIYTDGVLRYANVAGVMPIDGPYTLNYVGYGTQGSEFHSFFNGYLDDLRLYERSLPATSIWALYSMHDCCSGSMSGSYLDARRTCSGKERFDQRPCKLCKSDCGPMHFIDNWQKRCSSGATTDQTICKACSSCGVDQYMGRVCSGTSFYEEALCYACKYKSSADCPYGQVLVGRCSGVTDYDTSRCIDCEARCIGYDQDPQGIGQYISTSCVSSSSDYICTPCQQFCPSGTYIANRCDGRGRTDTGCSLCKSHCRAAERGVTTGEFITGSCLGNTLTDVQTCQSCRSCPSGTWASQVIILCTIILKLDHLLAYFACYASVDPVSDSVNMW